MEKAVIVGLFDQRKRDFEIHQILEEMKLLTESAGGEVLEFFYQKREAPDRKYLIGRGKAEEIKDFIDLNQIELVIFYNRLSNMQQRNLENFFEIKVIDRSRLILDIFATRARSLEGKLQVELAQLLYLLPRLTGRGIELSRLGGGIGTRGPGETRLEVDRRGITKRISIVNKKLTEVIKHRELQRKNRKLYPVPVASLVGYTSAGKSTLFRALTGEDVAISSQLFSTLDPLLRRVELGEVKKGYYFLLSDTVGFIREMPQELFKSFRATLEEVVQSDIIVHVVDIANPDYLVQKREVEKVLVEMQVPAQKVITVYNKIDLLEGRSPGQSAAPLDTVDQVVYVSAKEKLGILNLKQAIFGKYFSDFDQYTLSLPIGLIQPESIGRWAIVLNKNMGDGLLHMDILCSRGKMIKFKEKYGGYVE
jgi:GTP-binding protein HflX